MPQDVAKIKPRQTAVSGAGVVHAAGARSMVEDDGLQSFIDLLREPFNIDDWNDRAPLSASLLRSIPFSDEQNASRRPRHPHPEL